MSTFATAVKRAISDKSPIVALESTIISHGLPRPANLEVALEVEAIVRANGATPATIAMIDGEVHIGLEPSELDRIANDTNVAKASTRDLAIFAAKGFSAATTVAATAQIAHAAGISYFATGGLGGVHSGARESWDESADLFALATTPITVICAGVKSILDVAATLERLETFGIPLIGYKTDRFPGFYLIDSGFPLEHRVDSVSEIVQILSKRRQLKTDNCALIVANPVETEMARTTHDQLLKAGLESAAAKNITGKAVTPFLLDFFHNASNGESLRVNIEIIKSNAKLAAQIAAAAQ
ncbi:MAG: pseudouridine-5'-phosphate glycosidase [Streptomycetaceae bacterium]|jgi:pseudouridine-5'-phosphate glycosidase|nr:MAG: pseudouridine-5'-phosphate glycosidase [Streptomycetaceae bacterium]